MSSRMRIVVAGLLALLVALAGGGQVLAARTSAAEKMKQLNQQALADYQAHDYESAKLGLLEAVALGTKAGLTKHPMMSTTYLLLGGVYINGYKDKAKGKRAIAQALKIRPDATLSDAITTPALREVLAAAQADAAARGAGKSGGKGKAAEAKPTPVDEGKEKEALAAETPAKAAAPPAPVAETKSEADAEPEFPAEFPQPVYCPNPDEAPPEEDIELRCAVTPVIRAANVLLFYRLPGVEDFTPVKADRTRRGWYHAKIPANAVVGKSLQYYFEARNARDEVAASAGRNDSPNLMLIREGAPPVVLAMAQTESSPEPEAEASAKKDEEENPLARLDHARTRYENRRAPGSLIVGLGLGSGYGWHPERNLEYYTTSRVGSGFNVAGFGHIAPELGYQFADGFSLSVEGRLQLMPTITGRQPVRGSAAKGAMAALLKGTFYIGEESAQVTISGYAGYGEGFRFAIPPQGTKPPTDDTIRGGPGLGGLGLGFVYHVGPMLAVNLDARGLAGFPILGFVADLTLKMQLAF